MTRIAAYAAGSRPTILLRSMLFSRRRQRSTASKSGTRAHSRVPRCAHHTTHARTRRRSGIDRAVEPADSLLGMARRHARPIADPDVQIFAIYQRGHADRAALDSVGLTKGLYAIANLYADPEAAGSNESSLLTNCCTHWARRTNTTSPPDGHGCRHGLGNPLAHRSIRSVRRDHGRTHRDIRDRGGDGRRPRLDARRSAHCTEIGWSAQ